MEPFLVHTIVRDVTILGFAAIVFIGFPLARAHARRLERDRTGASRKLAGGDLSDARLERIERAVEAMALEVERMAEGQRFVTRLLSDRSDQIGGARLAQLPSDRPAASPE
jgi:hypothetical protein